MSIDTDGKVDYSKLPEDETLRETMRMWIEEGYEPGHFVGAILDNDLAEAVGRADYVMTPLIPDIVKWLHNEAPARCHGSREKTRAWRERFWPTTRPGNRLDDGSNEAIADREDFDYGELNP